MYEKQIILHNVNRKTQYVGVGRELGRLLLRPEVAAIVQELGSTVKINMGSNSIDIVPPLKKPDQKKFGKAIVVLAVRLDPTPPPPTFEIN